MRAFHPTCAKDSSLSRNTKEPSSEPRRVPQKLILIAYHTPTNYTVSKSNKRHLGGVWGTTIC